MATRLGDIAAETPKPVLQVGGRPFIAWLMREMLRFGVDDFVILTGHLPLAVEDAVLNAADSLPRRVTVRFSEEPHRAGTGGALFHAAPLLAERFLMCNGDSLFDCNIAALLADFARDPDDVLARMIVREIPDASRYGTVTLDGETVTAFRERPDPALAGQPRRSTRGPDQRRHLRAGPPRAGPPHRRLLAGTRPAGTDGRRRRPARHPPSTAGSSTSASPTTWRTPVANSPHAWTALLCSSTATAC